MSKEEGRETALETVSALLDNVTWMCCGAALYDARWLWLACAIAVVQFILGLLPWR